MTMLMHPPKNTVAQKIRDKNSDFPLNEIYHSDNLLFKKSLTKTQTVLQIP